jgi:hypothetical protein
MSLKARVKRSTKTPPVIEAPAPATPPAPAPVAPPAPAEPPSPTSTLAPIVIDPDLAELKALRARYRNRHKTGAFAEPDVEVKKRVRAELVARGISPKWSSLIARFGFDDETTYAMLRVLESPGRAHALWLVEARIAVRRDGLDLSALDYESIRSAIQAWRAERTGGKSVEG